MCAIGTKYIYAYGINNNWIFNLLWNSYSLIQIGTYNTNELLSKMLWRWYWEGESPLSF